MLSRSLSASTANRSLPTVTPPLGAYISGEPGRMGHRWRYRWQAPYESPHASLPASPQTPAPRVPAFAAQREPPHSHSHTGRSRLSPPQTDPVPSSGSHSEWAFLHAPPGSFLGYYLSWQSLTTNSERQNPHKPATLSGFLTLL